MKQVTGTLLSNSNNSVGIFFYAKSTGRYLYLLRSDTKHPDSWGLPGGKVEAGETLFQGAERECHEELSYFPADAKLVPIQRFDNGNFTYHTFWCAVDSEFVPVLNDEHSGYAWVASGRYPKPLHPGLFSTINFDVVQDKLHSVENKKAA
jgi:8-oxo-dGTP pyrophosphatase MutT (NUDIX family)